MQQRSILFAEDYPGIAKVYCEYFRQEEYDVTLASDGREALEILLARPESFAILRTDYNMPQMDGLELLQRLRKDHLDVLRHLRVVVKSSLLDKKILDECRIQHDVGVTIHCLNSENEMLFWNALIHGDDRWQEFVEPLQARSA